MTIFYTIGEYKCEVVDQGLSNSKTNNPQIWLRVRILESIDRPDEKVDQYERTIYWTLTEKTIDFTVEKLELLGFAGQSFRDLDPNVQGHHSFIGQQIDCYCKHETYEGKEREKWDLSNPGAKMPDPLSESDARRLDALFGRKLKDRFKKSGAAAKKEKPVPLAAEVAAVASDDDIPF